jgi:hypothetical protein
LLIESYLPWTFAFELQSRLVKSQVDTISVSVQFQPPGRPPEAASRAPAGRVRLRLPFGVSGAPAGMIAAIDDMAAQLVLPGGKLSKPLLLRRAESDKPWYTTSVEQSLYEQVKNTPLSVRAIALVTVYGNVHTERMSLEGNAHHVAGIGVCGVEPFEVQKTALVHCLVPFRLRVRTLAQFENGVPVEELVASFHSPYPADFGISPMDQPGWLLPNQAGATAIIFTTMQPLAHLRRELEIPNVQLAQFAE